MFHGLRTIIPLWASRCFIVNVNYQEVEGIEANASKGSQGSKIGIVVSGLEMSFNP